jgi:hypothetical protein
MNCNKPVHYYPMKEQMLIKQLKREYERDCTNTESVELRKILKQMDNLQKKLVILFHMTFFDNLDITRDHRIVFQSLLNYRPKDLKTIVEKIFQNNNYGNHRKYCAKSYGYYEKALDSFLLILPQLTKGIQNNESFGTLYRIMNQVYSFGRTSCWDFLERVDRTILNGKLLPTSVLSVN